MSKFNKIGNCELSNDENKFSTLNSLEINKKYQIKNINTMTTKYGSKLTVTLKDKEGIFFLPARFERLSDIEKQELLAVKNTSLVYKGEKTIGQYRNKTAIINFVDNSSSSSGDDSSSCTNRDIDDEEEIPKKE